MKFKNILKTLASVLAFSVFCGALASCSKEEDKAAGYGYVQFRLYKEASVKATVDKLSYLHDACKVQVIVQHEGATISQTLVLNSYNAENAEFGLRSDKLQLLKRICHYRIQSLRQP